MGCTLSIKVSPEIREFIQKHSPSRNRSPANRRLVRRDAGSPDASPDKSKMRGTGRRPRFDSHFSTNKVALVVGINDYPHWESLDTAEGGATQVADFLTSRGFEVKLLLGPAATRETIVRALQRIDVCRTAVIYFAGHGISGKHGPALVPHNALHNSHDVSDKIGQDYLQGWSKRTKAHGVLFVLDCCYGGDFCVKMRSNSSFCLAQKEKSRIVISSSLKGERVPDATPGESRSHSPFTGSLLESLRDECFSGSAIELFVATRARSQSRKDSLILPKLGRLSGDEGGDVMF